MGIVKGKHLDCCTSKECKGCYMGPSAASAGSITELAEAIAIAKGIIEECIRCGMTPNQALLGIKGHTLKLRHFQALVAEKS